MIRSNLLRIKTLLILIFLHGIISPILFLLVGVIYENLKTRQLLLIRGIRLSSPILTLFLIFRFLRTLPAPPFSSFISEVFFFFILSDYFFYSIIIIFFTLLISILFNLRWLIVCYSPIKNLFKINYRITIKFYTMCSFSFIFILFFIIIIWFI